MEIQVLWQDLDLEKGLDVKEIKTLTDLKTLILQGSKVFYWIGFGDGRDAIHQLFSDLDLSSIVIYGAEKQKEGGADGSPVGPMDDGVPTAASVLTESATPVAPSQIIEVFDDRVQDDGGSASNKSLIDFLPSNT